MTKRGLFQRFDAPKAEKLRIIAHAFLELSGDKRASRIYINEISESIMNGMLLSAIGLSTTLLEIWVRDLLVIRKLTQTSPETNHHANFLLTKIDRETEGLNYGKPFLTICKELYQLDVINSEEFEWLKCLYSQVRTPLHHGISGRIVNPEGQALNMLNTASSNEEMFLACLWNSAPNERADRLEDYIYTEVPRILGEILNFLAAHKIPKM